MSKIFVYITFFSLIFQGLVARQHRNDIHRDKNDKAVTSIETVYGDIYDCIDIYKQPSLAHPALRDHKIKLRPPKSLTRLSYARNVNKSNISAVKLDHKRLWKSRKGCPKGTIPIRRMKPLYDQRKESNKSRNHNYLHSQKWNHDQIEFAGIYSKPGKSFYGAAAHVNLYNPKITSDHAYSSASIIIESGDPPMEQIQVGWTVNPNLYGDYSTRMYTSWMDKYQSAGCYNTLCSGFVMHSSGYPLDIAFDQTISQPEGVQWEMQFTVTLVSWIGWWLGVGTPLLYLGYWPIELFTTMNKSADSVRFGGQVYTPPWEDSSPQMGSGVFKNGQYDKTCYIRQVKVIDEFNGEITADPVDVDNSYMEGTRANSRCYFEADESYKNSDDGYSFLFGGTGGLDEDTCLY